MGTPDASPAPLPNRRAPFPIDAGTASGGGIFGATSSRARGLNFDRLSGRATVLNIPSESRLTIRRRRPLSRPRSLAGNNYPIGARYTPYIHLIGSSIPVQTRRPAMPATDRSFFLGNLRLPGGALSCSSDYVPISWKGFLRFVTRTKDAGSASDPQRHRAGTPTRKTSAAGWSTGDVRHPEQLNPRSILESLSEEERLICVWKATGFSTREIARGRASGPLASLSRGDPVGCVPDARQMMSAASARIILGAMGLPAERLEFPAQHAPGERIGIRA